MHSSFNFGSGRTDDIYEALNYIYNNEELKEKYGDSFEIESDNVIGSSEGKTFMFLWLSKGEAEYDVTINDDIWTIKVSKSYFGKWKVMDFYLNIGETGNDS